MNTKNITVLDMDINMKDYPEFTDSFIIEAEWKDTGIELSEAEIDALNDDNDFVYDAVQDFIHQENNMTEDEYQLEEIYEVAVGDNGINRYTHEEFIILLTEMQDCYEWVCNFKDRQAMYADLKQLRGE